MAKAARAVPKRPPRRPSFPALVKRYQDELDRGLQAADHVERHRALQKTLSPYALAHLQGFFGKHRLESIDTKATTTYAMRRLGAGKDPDLVDGELKALSRLLMFAVEHGWLERHPTIHFVPRPRPARIDLGQRPQRWFGTSSVQIPAQPNVASRMTRAERDDIWERFLKEHPWSRATDTEGNRLSDNRRVEILAAPPFGLRVTRTAMVQRRRKQP
jgi:hypothetical protein